MKLLQKLRALLPSASPVTIAPTPPALLSVADAPLSDARLLELLAISLKNRKLGFQTLADKLVLSNGIELRPYFFEHHQISEQQVRSATGIHARHPSAFPAGLYEYQHATQQNYEASVSAGFTMWTKMDLLALDDALRTKPKDCTVMESILPPYAANFEPRIRHIVLGPVGHLFAERGNTVQEEHPFCPCCFMTQCYQVFEKLIQSEQFGGIYFFVSRDTQGQVNADCRVNGEDFPAAIPLLLAYANTWPARGLELRKQYVVLKNAETSLQEAQAMPNQA